jgi:hypothetical protein
MLGGVASVGVVQSAGTAGGRVEARFMEAVTALSWSIALAEREWKAAWKDVNPLGIDSAESEWKAAR